jgi:hypothetical protein
MAARFRAEALDELTRLPAGKWRNSLEDIMQGVLDQVPALPAA